MNDTLQCFLFEHAPIRGERVQLNATWQAVTTLRTYPAPLRQILGELMAAGSLLAATLKFDGTLILQLHGSGPVQLIVVECTSEHTLRATAKWSGSISNVGLRQLLGNGRFVINLVPRSGQQSYQGVVELNADSVAEIIEHYMKTSEQIDTKIWLSANAQQAAGLLLQKLPEAESPDVDAWNRVGLLASTVTSFELLNLPTQQLLGRLFHEEDVRLFEANPVCFRCSCTVARVADMLRMLGQDDVQQLIVERGEVEILCDFCNHRYAFDAVDAAQIFAQPAQTPPIPSPDLTRH
jgi:molecular chaperone Hsp33